LRVVAGASFAAGSAVIVAVVITALDCGEKAAKGFWPVLFGR
jgi:hypothetical protein